MSNLREGGLAIIIGGNQESNGGSFRCLIHSDQLFVKLSDGTIIDDYCLCFEHHLMPIDGEDFSHEDEHQKEREHA